MKKLLGSAKAARELRDATKARKVKPRKAKARRASTANIAEQIGP